MSYRQHVNNQLGASGKGAENYFTKIKSKLTLDKYYQQAKAFLNEFSSQINGKNKVVLLAFVTSYSRHFIYKKMILIRHKIFKQSKLDNLGLFLLK